ncbi:MAG: hypothetical protein HW412_1284 [Bacteroidetes bacterium]|nr:hypothetical protein [Bacteroidota bacterium]
MVKPYAFITILLAGVAVFISSCATIRYDEESPGDQKEIQKLQARLLTSPRNQAALRDLGAIYFRAKNYRQALEYLKKAFAVDSRDSKTIFYYGMSLEVSGNDSAALGVYINYSDVSSLSPYRKLIEGRYRQLTQDIIHRQFQSLLLREQSLGADRLGSKTLAVFPLQYQGKDEKYDALGKGLSEMIIIDLGQVKSLQLVERVRVEALLNELKLSQSKYVDQSTAPRMGKLLSAGKIVNGSFNVSGNNLLRLDVASWDVAKMKYPNPVTQSDALENLFKLEKDLVFGIIKEMGIQLSPGERERIQLIPTRNITAFLAYSIGLKEEDRRDFKAASVYYKQAVSLDPTFAPAKTKADAADALAAAGGDKLNAMMAAELLDGPPSGEKMSSNDLLRLRLGNLGGNIGSGFQPGEDDRKPAEEAARAGAPVGRLPAPPRPPQR